MKQINDGGPAFPNPALANEAFSPTADLTGMSLLDYFAAQALIGLLPSFNRGMSSDYVADAAYMIANAMLKAREVQS